MRSYAYLYSQPTLPPLVIDTTPKEASLSPMEESSASSSSTHSPHSGDATHRISYSLEVGSSVVMPSPQLVLSDGDKSPSIPGLTQSAIVASDKLKVPRTAVSVGPRHSAPTDAKTPIVKVSLTAARNLPQIPPNAPRPASIHPLPPRPAENSQASRPRLLSIEATRLQGSSPPPDPRSIAYISSGPSSNPLGIRPSSRPGIQRIISQPSSATPQQKNKNKKPIMVGNGWPYARPAAGGVNSTPLGAPSSGSRTQVHTTQPKVRSPPIPSQNSMSSLISKPSVTLTNIVSYTSPSPPLLSLPSNSAAMQLHTATKGGNQKGVQSAPSLQLANGRSLGVDSAASEIPGLKHAGSSMIKAGECTLAF